MGDHSGHHHHQINPSRAFAIGVFLNTAFVLAEIFFGVLSGSLALLADAGHNASDILGLLLAWGASILQRRQATQKRTYGWRSSTIMAALINAVILLVAMGGIAWEAFQRFDHPAPVASRTMILVAAVGVVINTATALLFLSDRKRDLNIRGAFMHMTADAAVSAGVVGTGILMILTGWTWLDPAISLVIAAIIVLGTWGLLRESLNLSLHAVPAGIDPQAIEAYLTQRPGVVAVHDLHIWAMSTTETALTAHIVKPDPTDDDRQIAIITKDLSEQFGISHVTLQWERQNNLEHCGSNCHL
jgi:cobalt-zinc-cadmium efflux system protein